MTNPGFVTFLDGELFLDWVPDSVAMASYSHESYFAKLPWDNRRFGPLGYRVHQWKGEWAYSRPKVETVPGDDGFTGRSATRREAAELCVEDARILYRLHLWQQYMMFNDPPKVS
jgi:hypothetical protein